MATSDEPESLLEAADRAVTATLLSDPAHLTVVRYNAPWQPRAYAIDRRGCISYVQGPGVQAPRDAGQEIDALWSRKE